MGASITVNAGTSFFLGADAALGVEGLFSGALTIDGTFTYASATPTEFTGSCTGAGTGFIVVDAAAGGYLELPGDNTVILLR